MMREVLDFFPAAASTQAGRVDEILYALTGVTIFFTTLIAGLIIFFAVFYRRKKRPRTPPAGHMPVWLEVTWTVVPLAIALGFFAWGGRVFLEMYATGSPDAYEVYVVGKQWMWKFQHPSGRREINELHLPIGQPVRLIMVSQDVIHDVSIPAFRIKHDVLPMKYSALSFTPSLAGSFHLFCSQYCGTKHSEMVGWVFTMEPERFQEWLSAAPGQGSPVEAGKALLETLGCRSCHRADSADTAPRLEGLFGGVVRLADGSMVRADENYLRESILSPKAKVVSGFQPVMPSYQGRVTEEELAQILAYLKSSGGTK